MPKDIGKHLQQIIHAAKSCRDDLTVVINWHQDPVISDGAVVSYKIKTIGRLLDEKYTPAALFSMLLFTNVDFKKGVPVYEFITQRARVGQTTIPAKSPMEMLPPRMPNDLVEVIKLMKDYYGVEE